MRQPHRCSSVRLSANGGDEPDAARRLQLDPPSPAEACLRHRWNARARRRDDGRSHNLIHAFSQPCYGLLNVLVRKHN